MKKLSMLVLFISFIFSGCSMKSISNGNSVSESQAEKIIAGQSTKDDVIIMFGEPTKISSNGMIYYYSWERGNAGKVIGLSLGSSTSSSFVVIFDNNDVVKKSGLTQN